MFYENMKIVCVYNKMPIEYNHRDVLKKKCNFLVINIVNTSMY